MQRNYSLTRVACYIGYITQAITINLATLFFVIFQDTYHISFASLGQLVLVTFLIQLAVDFLSIRLVVRIGYRASGIAAHVFASLGLIFLGILPTVMPDPYMGILIAAFFYSIGGGLTEVIISPLVDSLPSDAKASSMSLLHSFYSWGLCLVVIVTTLLLRVFGEEHWNIIPFLWALIPIFNAVLFCIVPIPKEEQSEEKRNPLRSLLHSGVFYVFILLMICGGAAEQAMSQWASLFAEKAIGVSKVVGDILGPCFFAVMMIIGRTFYGVCGKKIRIAPVLFASAILSVICYLLTVFSRTPSFALIGCGVCGLGISLMWPGVLSLSSAKFPLGGSPMFAVLALAGDLGCSIGPWLTGVVSDFVTESPSSALSWIAGNTEQVALKSGVLVASVFPLVMTIVLGIYIWKQKKTIQTNA